VFRFEEHMTPRVVEWMNSRGLLFRQEFVTPWGTCDLVGVKLDAQRTRRRIRLKQTSPIGPLARVQLLLSIPDQESGTTVGLRELRRRFRGVISEDLIESQVDLLLRRRLVFSPRTGRLQRINGWTPLHRKIVAVELKLSRAQEALAQASSHRYFADESYVALPKDRAIRLVLSARGREFKARGVGILAVTEQTCKIVLKPVPSVVTPNRAMQVYCVERFWAREVRGIGASTAGRRALDV
jgi:hypothetical protein